jgi:hypothetical protein
MRRSKGLRLNDFLLYNPSSDDIINPFILRYEIIFFVFFIKSFRGYSEIFVQLEKIISHTWEYFFFFFFFPTFFELNHQAGTHPVRVMIFPDLRIAIAANITRMPDAIMIKMMACSVQPGDNFSN